MRLNTNLLGAPLLLLVASNQAFVASKKAGQTPIICSSKDPSDNMNNVATVKWTRPPGPKPNPDMVTAEFGRDYKAVAVAEPPPAKPVSAHPAPLQWQVNVTGPQGITVLCYDTTKSKRTCKSTQFLGWTGFAFKTCGATTALDPDSGKVEFWH